MADTKVSALPVNTSVAASDKYYLVDSAVPTSEAVEARRILPRLTTAQMNALAGSQSGDMIHNTDVDEPFFYNGVDWVSVVDGLPE